MGLVRNNKNGYTLLESLIVLSIASMMSVILISNVIPIYHKKVIDSFFEQFEKDMMYAQQYALIHKEPVFILFRGNEYEYRIEQTNLAGPLIIRNYHSKIKVEGVTLKNRVTYKGNGAIQSSGSLHVTYNGQIYKVIFYLGKGRINIEKL